VSYLEEKKRVSINDLHLKNEKPVGNFERVSIFLVILKNDFKEYVFLILYFYLRKKIVLKEFLFSSFKNLLSRINSIDFIIVAYIFFTITKRLSHHPNGSLRC